MLSHHLIQKLKLSCNAPKVYIKPIWAKALTKTQKDPRLPFKIDQTTKAQRKILDFHSR